MQNKVAWNWFNCLTRIITAIFILNYRLVAFVYSKACRRIWDKPRPCQINQVDHPKTFIERNLCVITGRLPCQPARIKFTQCVRGQKSAFSSLQEKLCVGSKNDCHLLVLSRRPLSRTMQSLGISNCARRLQVRKCDVFVCQAWSACAWGHSLNRYCVDCVYGSILVLFSSFFRKLLPFQKHQRVVVFVARWRHNFRKIAVDNCENSKNHRKSLCAPLRIHIRKILTKFYRIGLRPRTDMDLYNLFSASRKLARPNSLLQYKMARNEQGGAHQKSYRK